MCRFLSSPARPAWILLVLVLHVAVAPRSFGQERSAAEIEAMAARLAHTAGDERLALLVELTSALTWDNPRRAQVYAQEALEQLEASGGDDAQRITLYLSLSWIHRAEGDYDAGVAWAEKAGDLARATGDRERQISSLRAIAASQHRANDVAEALATLHEARWMSETLDGYRLGPILIDVGSAYGSLGSSEESLDAYLQAYRQFEARGSSTGLAVALANVASVYLVLGRHDEAIEYYGRGLEIFDRADHPRQHAKMLNLMGDAEHAAGRPARALELHLAALEGFEALGATLEGGAALLSLGGDHRALGDRAAADAYYRRALAVWEGAGHALYHAQTLTALGQLDRERGHLEAARTKLERAVALLAGDNGDAAIIDGSREEATLELAEVYRALGRDRDAFDAYARHQALVVRRLEEEKGRNLAAMQVRFDVGQKESQIELLKQTQALQGLELEAQRAARRSLILVFSLVLGAILFAFYRSRLKTREAMMLQTVEQERTVNVRLRKIDRLKDQFLANTSHELKTPLFGITGLAESLIDGAAGTLPASAERNLGMIVSSGRRLGRLVDDILDHAKLTQGSLALHRRPVDVAALAGVVLTLLRPLAEKKGLRLVESMPEDLPPAEADEHRLEQILYNLIGNGIKFTEAGEVRVGAALEDGRIAVWVEDTGIGIPAEKREAVFDAFEQGDSAVDRRFGGTGLGLTVAKELVELHGGRLRLAADRGEGARFVFDLPLAREAGHPEGEANLDGVEPESEPGVAVAPSAPEVPRPPSPAGAAKARILVVDDEPINLQVVSNHLAPEGYHLELAASGKEALQRLASEAFDAVLLDVMMPKMSGFDVCAQVRARFPINELPVIFLTALGQVTDLVSAYRAGANDYLTKPVAKPELLARVETHLELLAVHRDVAKLGADRLDQIKILSGFLPICCVCKKIRDDDGYWQEVEEYIDRNSEARFSHGLCAGCAAGYLADAGR